MRAQLRELGERRRRLKEEQEAASRDLRELVRRALEEDVTQAEIMRLADVSRQALWKIVRGD